MLDLSEPGSDGEAHEAREAPEARDFREVREARAEGGPEATKWEVHPGKSHEKGDLMMISWACMMFSLDFIVFQWACMVV